MFIRNSVLVFNRWCFPQGDPICTEFYYRCCSLEWLVWQALPTPVVDVVVHAARQHANHRAAILAIRAVLQWPQTAAARPIALRRLVAQLPPVAALSLAIVVAAAK